MLVNSSSRGSFAVGSVNGLSAICNGHSCFINLSFLGLMIVNIRVGFEMAVMIFERENYNWLVYIKILNSPVEN